MRVTAWPAKAGLARKADSAAAKKCRRISVLLLSNVGRASWNTLPHQIFQVADLFADQIQLASQSLNFRLRSPVYIEVELAANPIFLVLTVLAHHDDGSLNRGQHREK